MMQNFKANNWVEKSLIVLFFLLTSSGLHAQDRILFITSNQDYYGNTKISAANHFGEIVAPYHTFIKAGYAVDFVSPEGGAIPVGYINTSDSLQKQYLYDAWFMDKLEHTMRPAETVAANYQAIFYCGGGAAMYGVPADRDIQQIASDIYDRNGVISSVCHGTAGISFLKDKNGQSLYAGKRITGYPDDLEKKEMEYYKALPFSIDKAINDNGGHFVYSKNGGDGFYVVDGRFVTGQDPASGSKVANEVIAILKNNFVSGKIMKNDAEQIREILLDYIEGTANGQPERLRSAFHPDFNLYTVARDTLWIRSGKQYISNIKLGEKNNRKGEIISIDIEKDAAIAKVKIAIPGRIFTDYFLILRYQGAWRIVHKSYSWREIKKE